MTDKKVGFETKLSMQDINERIKKEVCYETLQELTDTNLMIEYKNSI